MKSRITFVRFYFEFTINSSILLILSNSAIKSIRIIIIINVIDRNIRIFILSFIEQCFFLSFGFRFNLSKNFQNNFNDARTTKFVSNVIHQIINRMFVIFFFVLILDFVNLKKVFRNSNLFFRNNSFHSKFRTSYFRFCFRFQFRFQFKIRNFIVNL